MSKVDQQAWHRLMTAFNFSDNQDTYKQLLKTYQEKHRKYHTLEHIEATLRHLEQVADQFDKPEEAALALWFHDAIYAPFSSSNELDSAKWARRFLQDNGASQDSSERVFALIMATLHTAKLESNDACLLVDIDLSILGASEAVYEQFEQNVRYEYKRVPYFLYRKKRKQILQSFLDRPTVYQTDYFADKYEVQARWNMQNAISNL